MMPNTTQSNPSDASDAFFQPDWNTKYGNGVSVPANRDVTRSLDDIYDSQRNGAKQRAGVTLAAPTITSLSPATGGVAGGTVTTITGDNFTGATGATFGGTAGTAFSVKTDNTVQVTTPAKSAGAVTVVVNTPHGNATKTTGFTFS